MTTPQAAPAVPTSSKLLCAAYAVIAMIALIATWSQNVAYLDSPAGFGNFWVDTKVNPASRSITVDVVLVSLAAAVFMVTEARKHGIRYVWAYIVGAGVIAISVTFPLFLLARELKLSKTEPSRLATVDAVVLGVLTVFLLAFVVWVDLL